MHFCSHDTRINAKLLTHVCPFDVSALQAGMKNPSYKHSRYILLHEHKPCVFCNCCRFLSSDHKLCIKIPEHLNGLGCVPEGYFYV